MQKLISRTVTSLAAVMVTLVSTAAGAQTAPVDAAPVDAAPVDAAPVDAAPVDAAPVPSADESAPTKEPMLVLPITVQEEDRSKALVLSRLFLEELGRFEGIDVVSGMELERLVSLEAEKEAAGCLDESCMAEIAGALGADYVVSSQFSRLGSQSILTVQLFRASQARVIKRASRRANDVGIMADLLRSLAVEIMSEEFSRTSAKKPASTIDVDPVPKAAVLPEATGDGEAAGAGIVPWAVAGTGVAAMVVGVAAGALGVYIYNFTILGPQLRMKVHAESDLWLEFDEFEADLIAEDRASLEVAIGTWGPPIAVFAVASALLVVAGSVAAGGGLGWGLLE